MKIELQFDFSDPTIPSRLSQPIRFSAPQQIITTHKLDKVIPCLHQVQEAVDAGYYAAGYIAYEAAPAFHAAMKVLPKGELPLLWFALFDQPDSTDRNTEGQGAYQISTWQPSISQKHYHADINTIKKAIRDGLTYQVNYTLSLQAQFQGDDYAYYQQLRKAQKANYAAYLNTGRYRILSASPELFFYWNGEQIITRPMKGTKQRGLTRKQDQQYYQWLAQSEKDRAENSMIVDLMRNDIAKIAHKGSVQVASLFDIETYPTVFQMTSTITANTQADTNLVDVFTALFPCGSITGAPKISTMQIISQLEDTPRQVYCGAIGMISPEKEMIFNVPIRTLLIDQQTGLVRYGTGGGVTWDSTVQGEYTEAITKSRFLHESTPSFKLLESLLLTEGDWFLFERHLQRLKESAEYFAFPISIDQVKKQLLHFAKQHATGDYKVRFMIDEHGEIQIEKTLLTPLKESCLVRLSSSPVHRSNRFLYHKTTVRSCYEQQKQAHSDVFDVLLYNELGELTEFTIGNLVVEIEGEKWTPPVHCGLLAGTFRAELIENGEIRERILTKQDLVKVDRIWLINSVRGWVPVTLVD